MSIRELLDNERTRLLQLDGKNPLLNFRSTTKSLEIPYPDLLNLTRRLLDLEKIRILAKEESLFAQDALDARSIDLAWKGTPEALSNRLLSIDKGARGFIEEQGVNILYLGMGWLHWREHTSSGVLWKAPLFLIPVELIKGEKFDRSGNPQYTLRYNEDPIESNHTLIVALQQFYHLSIPSLPEVEEIEMSAFERQFNKWQQTLEDAFANHPEWRIDWNTVALGFFSFTKLMMYKDLESTKWVNAQNPEGPKLMRQLFFEGFGEVNINYNEHHQLDTAIPPDQPVTILDMDSSQVKVVLETRTGKSLVVEGPPGTGKSQTIANILADAMARNQKVLFVSEKRAALDVVKRRMEQAGLGKACLELHGAKAKKTEFTKDLSSILNNPTEARLTKPFQLEELAFSIKELREWSSAVNEPLGNQFTPIELMGNILGIKEKLTPYIAEGLGNQDYDLNNQFKEAIQKFTKQDIGKPGETGREVRSIIALQNLINQLGFPLKHPLWGIELEQPLLLHQVQRIEDILDEIINQLNSSETLFNEVLSFLNISLPDTGKGFDKALLALKLLQEVPLPFHTSLATLPWNEREIQLVLFVQQGQKLFKEKTELEAFFLPLAFQSNVSDARIHLATIPSNLWNRMFNSKLKGTFRLIKSLLKVPSNPPTNEYLALIDRLISYQEEYKEWKDKPLGNQFFGPLWRDLESDWALIEAGLRWLVHCHIQVNNHELPKPFIQTISEGRNIKEALQLQKQAQSVLSMLNQSKANLSRELAFRDGVLSEMNELTFSELRQRINSIKASLPQLGTWVQYRQICTILRESGFSLFVGISESKSNAGKYLVDLFYYKVWEDFMHSAQKERPLLRRLSGVQLDQIRTNFARQDSQLKEYHRVHLHNQHTEATASLGSAGQAGALRRVAQMSRRIPPIRKVIKDSFDALTTIKPIFMMSPLSVASYLEPIPEMFDLIVFDEASQIEPVDAFGAIMRGKQIIVVGDTKQMPPSSFFQRLLESADFSDQESEFLGSVQSIMDVMKAKCPAQHLQWHYRSRHHSLIEPSNLHFYDEKLLVFPSAVPASRHLGVNFILLPSDKYPYEGSGVNQSEARRVAEEVYQYHNENPSVTLGVVAFGIKQADKIDREIQMISKTDTNFAAFINNTECAEPFFVKNLENVQGDERDVIFISVGYGINNGSLSQNFGPLTREGGERRLNVMITRARRANFIFSNFTHADMRVDAGTPHGTRLLKDYLMYAETGNRTNSVESALDADSPFETEVAASIRTMGYEVEHQVGCKGYRIDLAVRHPEKPGVFLLGVECDGATYHRSRSARDRDRLRQNILEGLGWNIYRIWSTDWFINKEGQRAKLSAHLKFLIESWSTTSPTLDHVEAEAPSTIELKPPQLSQSTSFIPYTLVNTDTWRPLSDFPYNETISKWVTDIVEAESPVHKEVVFRRIVDYQGVRLGPVIRNTLSGYLTSMARKKLIDKRGDFIYKVASNGHIEPRCYENLSKKDIEWIAPEELEQAICSVIRQCFSIHADDLIREVGSKLGFRITSEVHATIQKAIDKMTSKSIIYKSSESICTLEN